MRTIPPILFLLPLCVMLGVSCSDRHGPFEPDEYTSAVNIRLEFPEEGTNKATSGNMVPKYGILTMHETSSQACESEIGLRFSGNTASGSAKITHRGTVTKHFRVFIYDMRWIPIYTGTAMNVVISPKPEISVTIALKRLGMVTIPGGSFQRGSVTGDPDEQPENTVYVNGFEMSATEVTVTQFQKLLADIVHPLFANEPYLPNRKKLGDLQPTYTLDPTSPMDFSSGIWGYVPAYCNQLSMSLGYQPCYTLTGSSFSTWDIDMEANGFRLPTEAEWEYACRAGTTSDYSSGNGVNDLERVGWCATNGYRPNSVALKAPNAWGLYDMHGNAWELCQDSYSDTYYQTSVLENPFNDGPKPYVLRGGSWESDPTDCRSSNRQIWKYLDGNQYVGLKFGFRVVRRL